MRGTKITEIEPALTREIIISSQVPGPMRAATTKTAHIKSIQARTGTAVPAIIMATTTEIIHMIITITMAATTIMAATEAGTAAVTAAMVAVIPAVEILVAVAETDG
ncbi:hypothetical protein J2Z70_006614 [Paenibacillus silagei]|uniref:Uncharacterized protein n=1 Tax=Paenibacillus silagei TaxID=1670801 RepID=A0ABS4P271_9BACL|nr:hypothetical protein [Paenibacillus silagei]